MYLGVSVSLLRRKTKNSIGTGSTSPRIKLSAGADEKEIKEQSKLVNEQKLAVAVRSIGNFTEAVPLPLLFIFMAESNGASSRFAHGALAILFALRVAHVEFGLKGRGAAGPGRPVGALGTWVIAVVAGVYNFRLGIKGLGY